MHTGSLGCWGPCQVELNVFKDADSKTFLGTFSIVSKCSGLVFFSFLSPTSPIWLALPLFPLRSVASCAVAVHFHEGSSLALSSYWWQQDLPWASCFSGWTFPTLSASLHMSGALACLTTSVASPGLIPVCRWVTLQMWPLKCQTGGVLFLPHFCYSSLDAWHMFQFQHTKVLQSGFPVREPNFYCCTRHCMKGETGAHFTDWGLRLSLTTSNVLCINLFLF